MAIEYTIDPVRRMVLVTCSGVVTYDDLRSYAIRLRSDPEFTPDHASLVDTSTVKSIEISFKLLSEYRRNMDPYGPRSKRAVVAPGDHSYGVARIYQALQANENYRVFRTAAEAQAWMSETTDKVQ